MSHLHELACVEIAVTIQLAQTFGVGSVVVEDPADPSKVASDVIQLVVVDMIHLLKSFGVGDERLSHQTMNKV